MKAAAQQHTSAPHSLPSSPRPLSPPTTTTTTAVQTAPGSAAPHRRARLANLLGASAALVLQGQAVVALGLAPTTALAGAARGGPLSLTTDIHANHTNIVYGAKALITHLLLGHANSRHRAAALGGKVPPSGGVSKKGVLLISELPQRTRGGKGQTAAATLAQLLDVLRTRARLYALDGGLGLVAQERTGLVWAEVGHAVPGLRNRDGGRMA